MPGPCWRDKQGNCYLVVWHCPYAHPLLSDMSLSLNTRPPIYTATKLVQWDLTQPLYPPSTITEAGHDLNWDSPRGTTRELSDWLIGQKLGYSNKAVRQYYTVIPYCPFSDISLNSCSFKHMSNLDTRGHHWHHVNYAPGNPTPGSCDLGLLSVYITMIWTDLANWYCYLLTIIPNRSN